MKKLLNKCGFKAELSEINKKDKEPLIFNGFRNDSVHLLESIINGEDLQRDIKYNTKKHLSVQEFKKQKAIEDLKKEPEIQEKAKNEIISSAIEKLDTPDKINNELLKNNKELKEENKKLQKYYNMYCSLIRHVAEFANRLINKIDKSNNSEERNVLLQSYNEIESMAETSPDLKADFEHELETIYSGEGEDEEDMLVR